MYEVRSTCQQHGSIKIGLEIVGRVSSCFPPIAGVIIIMYDALILQSVSTHSLEGQPLRLHHHRALNVSKD